MTKIKDESIAATKFIELIESGTYQNLKQTEIFLEQAKQELRQMLEPYETKRHEFKEINMVAKFVRKCQWETNHAGLIEELLCYVRPEYALSVIQLDTKLLKEKKALEQLTPYQLPTSFYVKPALNKSGKEKIKTYDYLFGGQDEKQLIEEIRDVTHEHEQLKKKYDRFKRIAGDCPVLKAHKKVTTPYGSISLIANNPKWDLAKILEAFGEDFLINYGKVNMSKLDDFISQRIVPKSVVSAYRKLVDIRLDFVVMDLDKEAKAMEFVYNNKFLRKVV